MPPVVTLKLYATLQAFAPAGEDTVTITPGTTVQDLLRRIGVPEDQARLIFVDGVRGEMQTVLSGGERVGIFPPVGGG